MKGIGGTVVRLTTAGILLVAVGCGDDGAPGTMDGVDAGRPPPTPSCENRVTDGDESDVDCGGSCEPCRVGRDCNADADCDSGNCTSDGTCGSFPTCSDGKQNGLELGLDCGGPACDGCPDGNDCELDRDCASERCDDGTCTSCEDGGANGTETGVDCGGRDCGPCVDGFGCEVDDDCLSMNCDDGVCASCFDGVVSGDESDVDCGGPECRKCPDGGGCGEDADCVSGTCADGSCISCRDGVRNGTETDIDCGGAACSSCALGAACLVDDDCLSGSCDADTLVCASCDDGLRNRDETDIDCGGATCAACADGLACVVDDDCTSQSCADDVCRSCEDGVENGDETDVDCGGAECGPCADGEGCGIDDDCACGGTCASMTCDTGGLSEFDRDDDYRVCERTATTAPCPDISGTGTEITIADDDRVDVTLPFTFEFYGVARTSVRIESNGALTFGPVDDEDDEIHALNECLPTDPTRDEPANQAMIAVFWDDLDPSRVITGEENSVYHETRGTSPNREFVVQWQVAIFDGGALDTNSAMDLRAVLHETTHEITVCYVDTDTEDRATCDVALGQCHEEGLSATAGIQEDETNGLEYSCDEAELTDDLVLEWTPL